MSVTNDFLKAKAALLKLQDLNVTDISNSLTGLQSLADEGILDQNTVDSMITSYKAQIKAMVDKEVALAQSQADMWASSSETEVESKVKNMAVAIAGVPVIISPTPIEAAVDETTFLSNATQTTTDLTNLLNNLNSILT